MSIIVLIIVHIILIHYLCIDTEYLYYCTEYYEQRIGAYVKKRERRIGAIQTPRSYICSVRLCLFLRSEGITDIHVEYYYKLFCALVLILLYKVKYVLRVLILILSTTAVQVELKVV